MPAFILALLIAILPPCQAEDSDNCYWDASARGNGLGNSFVGFMGETYYTEGK